MQHGVAGGGPGVYGLGDAAEVDALAGEVVQDVEEVAHAAAQPVELSHNERIAGLEVLQTLRKGRARHGRAALAVVGKNAVFPATGFFQRTGARF